MRARLLAFVLTSPALTLGCVAGVLDGPSADDAAPAETRIERYCAETECEQEIQTCYDGKSYHCDLCRETCGEPSGDYWTYCTAECNTYCDSLYESCEHPCGSDSPCVRESYRLIVPERSNAELLEACDALAKHVNDDCGGDYFPHCPHLSRLYRPEVAQGFRCEAQLACGSDAASCWAGLGLVPGTLGEDLCGLCNNGYVCTPENIAAFDDIDGMLLPEAHDAVYSCFSSGKTCIDLWDCIDAFYSGIDTMAPDLSW